LRLIATQQVYQEAEKWLREEGDLSLLVEHDHLIHDIIVRYCDNERLIDIVGGLSDLIDWACNTVVERQADSYAQGLPEHLQILDALQARDAEAAQTALRTHLEDAFDRPLETSE
jgi:DNA-binding GntR family transcriptional regulator